MTLISSSENYRITQKSENKYLTTLDLRKLAIESKVVTDQINHFLIEHNEKICKISSFCFGQCPRERAGGNFSKKKEKRQEKTNFDWPHHE